MKKILFLFILFIFSLSLSAQTKKNNLFKNTNTIPADFIFDPASSYNSYKQLTSVSLPGQFNGWNTSANILTYDSNEKLWKARLYLNPGEYEYKFYLNGSQWTEDPDNPITRTSYGNSVAIIKNIDYPRLSDFSIPNGTLLSDSINNFNLTAKIYPATDGTPIATASISLELDGTLIGYKYDENSNFVNITIEKSKLAPGAHKILFLFSDTLNRTGKEIFSFGVKNSASGYTYIDEAGDNFLPYPKYIPEGSADIEYMNINTNGTLDTLVFRIKMAAITNYTRVGFLMFNNITGTYFPLPPKIKINTVDWSNQGIYIQLMNPDSKFYDSSKYNYIYVSSNPEKKGNKINLEPKALTNNEFVFKLAISDINNLIGEYNGKKYFSIFSYLSDSSGNDLQVTLPGSGTNQTMVYDIAFARKIRQNILLSNTSSSRTARLDNELRGIGGISPEEINPALKNSGPIVKILTQSNNEYYSSSIIIKGTISDPEIKSADIYRDNIKISTIILENGAFTGYVVLYEGDNSIKVIAKNQFGIQGISNTIKVKYIINHNPLPKFIFTDQTGGILLDASTSSDPDNDIDTYTWVSDDKINPIKLNINKTGKTLLIPKPNLSGEYYFNLTVADKNSNKATIRNYFILDTSGAIKIPDINSNPQWVKDAIVYEIFLKSFSPEGTFSSVTKKITYLKEMGINTLWLMPIMHNPVEISEMSAGYNIDNFYDIAPQYGTFDDYKTMVDSAHASGIKVILDITPNHTSDKNPWVTDIRNYGKYSNYYNFLSRETSSDSRGLGLKLISDSAYSYYSNWTNLANLNLGDSNARDYMIKMFKWWLTDMNTDGFRWDVYWGPQNRYGKETCWRPIREELKKIKPDVFLLGETDGTGGGSENNYADGGGACDAAYDWAFYTAAKQIFSSMSISGLHDKATNYGYSPGENSYFFRFLENHDEDRIASLVDINKHKNLISLLMTVPGIPMIYQGQEVGWKNKRSRVDFSNPDGSILIPYYKRIINTRKKFPAFRTKIMKRISSGDGSVYAYIRPYKDENALVILNFSPDSKEIGLNINESSDLLLSKPLSENKDYFLNDFSNDNYLKIKKSDLSKLQISLSSYEAKVMILSDKIMRIPTGIRMNEKVIIPDKTSLEQNYPNPFNPLTNIIYNISKPVQVKIVVYDLLGRVISTLVNEFKSPGSYIAFFDSTFYSAGIYFYKLTAGDFSEIKKMIVLK